MIQSSGKLPYDGSIAKLLVTSAKETRYEAGLFDQCISSGSPIGEIKGKYCSVYISPQPLHPDLNEEDFTFDEKSPSGALLKVPRTAEAARKPNPFALTNPADLIIGLCLPSSCSAQDVRNAVAQRIGRTTFQFSNKQQGVDGSEVGNNTTLYSFITITHDRLCHTELNIREESGFFYGLYIAFMYFKHNIYLKNHYYILCFCTAL